MAFNAGAIVGTMKMDTAQWNTPLKSAAKGVGVLAAAVGTIVVGALGKANAAAEEWQKSLSNVNTLVSENSVDSQEMAKALLNLDASLGSTTELTDAMYQAFSAGASTMDEALEVTEQSAMFARAGLTDTSTAVDVLTTAVNAYGKENMTAQQASDLFFTTVKQGKITGEQLASTIGQSIPLFASAGISMEELNAGIAAMTKQGISASESTTQLNGIVNAFLKPSTAMTEQLAALGYESGSAFLEAEGLAGAMEMVETATNGDAAAIAELMPNIRAMSGTMALTGTGGEEFANILEEMENAAGATTEAFGEQELTLDTMRNQLDKVQLVVGNVSKFFTDQLAVGVTKAAKGMLSFIMSSQGAELVGNIIGGVAAAGEYLQEGFRPIVEDLGPALKGVWDSLTTTIGQFADKNDEGTGAFSLFSSAAQFTAASLEVLGKTAELVIESIGDLVQAILASGRTVGSFFEFLAGKTTWDEVRENAQTAGDAFKTFGQNVAENAVEIWDTLGENIRSFSDEVAEQSIVMETAVVSSFTSQKNNIVSNWDEMITGQSEAVEGMMDQYGIMLDETTDATEEAVEEQETVIGRLKNAWKEAFSEAEFSASAAYDSIMSSTDYLVSNLSQMTQDNLQNQIDAIDTQEKEETAYLERKLEKGIISQKEFDDAILAIQKGAAKEKDDLARKAFEAEKEAKVAQAWMSAADAIVGWWSVAPQLGPIAGPIYAGAMTAVTLGVLGGQLATINDQKYVPAFATGGTMPYDGAARVNEKGGEIMQLPGGTTIIPNDISKNIAANSGRMQNVINIHNPVVNDEAMLSRLANRVSSILGKQFKYGVR